MRATSPPPGRMIDVDGHQLLLLCEGKGGPTVILETGMPGMPLTWSHIQPGIAQFTRVCSYDRAGTGWSDPGPAPRTGRQIVSELHVLLQQAGLEPPYVFVAGSFGGHYARLYTSQYPDEVAGLVFVDCSHEDMVANFPPAMRRIFPVTKYFMGIFAFLARLGITRLLGARLPLFTQIFQEGTPDEVREQLLMHFARPEQWDGMYAEAAVYRDTEAEVRAARKATPSFGDIPLVVLTAQGSWSDPKLLPPGVKPGEITPIWLRLQQDLASLSSQSTHRVFDELTHTMMIGPVGGKEVIEATRQVVEAVRSRSQDVAGET